MSLLDDAVTKLAAGAALEPSYRDHLLVGDYPGCRECHIKGDWLLVYMKVEHTKTLRLVRTGSHSELDL
jgi:mRNA interferase YafQ